MPYWPGSPYGGDDHNSMDDGDRHNWDVWHGQYPRHFGERAAPRIHAESVTYLRYAEDRCRFQSEFGMHAAPVFETLRRSIPEDQRFHHSESLDWHNKDNPKDKGDMLMQSTTGVPADLAEYITFSQIAQAEGLKFGIEHFRRRMPHCSGALVWQLNDCWPVLSWSVLDYYGFGKASYYYLKRVFAPVLASFKQADDGSVELLDHRRLVRWVSASPCRAPWSFDGTVIWEGSDRHRRRVVQPSRGALGRRATRRGARPCLTSVAVRGLPRQPPLLRPIKDLARTSVRP